MYSSHSKETTLNMNNTFCSLLPANEFCEGYVKPVCHSVHKGEGCIPACNGSEPPPPRQEDRPPQEETRKTPRKTDSPGRQPPSGRQTPRKTDPIPHSPGAVPAGGLRTISGRYASYWSAYLFKNDFS